MDQLVVGPATTERHHEGVDDQVGGLVDTHRPAHDRLVMEVFDPGEEQGEDNKDHVLFPRRIDGRYAALHRRASDIWLASSTDLVTWPEEHMGSVMGPRADNWWDPVRIGGGGPPIHTEHGWLTLYHGYQAQHVYRIGVAMLDLEDPSRVINRPREPIFEPEEAWEIRGDVPHVVFSAANPVVDGTVYVYYGAADHVIGLATCSLDDLIDYALHG